MQGWLDDQGAGQIGANGLYFGLQSESDSVATRAESRARTMTASIMAWSDSLMRVREARFVPTHCESIAANEGVAQHLGESWMGGHGV